MAEGEPPGYLTMVHACQLQSPAVHFLFLAVMRYALARARVTVESG